MLILGIESSCDDTSVALLNCSKQGCFVINEKTASQIAAHKKYGGVVPEIAGRLHAEKIVPLIEEVLEDVVKKSPLERGRGVLAANTSRPAGHPPLRRDLRPDAIAVTAGPGLITGLIVGVEAAKALSYAWNIPLVAVNHIEGHIYSVEMSNVNCHSDRKEESLAQLAKWTEIPRRPRGLARNDRTKIQYPALALIVSGGHTELILIKKEGQYKLLGKTKDDAAGECFDKIAKLLHLPYPGGPQISKLGAKGNPKAINFPRPMLNQANFYFSFSGLKTSALYWLKDHTVIARSPSTRATLGAGSYSATKQSPRNHGIASLPMVARNDTVTINDFCASLEQAIIDVLVGKTLNAAKKYKPKTIIVGGGVSANKKLRETLEMELKQISPYSLLLTPSFNYCMDNAAMIALAGYKQALRKKFTPWRKIKADPNWELTN